MFLQWYAEKVLINYWNLKFPHVPCMFHWSIICFATAIHQARQWRHRRTLRFSPLLLVFILLTLSSWRQNGFFLSLLNVQVITELRSLHKQYPYQWNDRSLYFSFFTCCFICWCIDYWSYVCRHGNLVATQGLLATTTPFDRERKKRLELLKSSDINNK